ncbi:MAG: phosphotransferase [Rickettsiaceae bacterium]|jgi:regulator of PEP synthase PpsR (kinase-PPPase family)|nr:phosphotransferase [Rickettsiaceae bacterium]
MNFFHLHLISDSTGETVSSVARAALAQYEGVEVEEHNWSLVRTRGQVDKVLENVRKNGGFVMYTMADRNLRHHIKQSCNAMDIPCVSVLSKVITDLSSFLDKKTTAHQPGKQHELDEEYFSRVEAINFALAHDDGQSVWDLEEADVVLIGASRTSKSPTSMYLAYRGYRAANVPYVSGVPLPEIIETLKKPLIIGLTISPDVLVQIRKNRLLSINEEKTTDYVDIDKVKEELIEVRKIFTKNKWPVIDVTRRSVEETTATIIQYFQKKKETESNGS